MSIMVVLHVHVHQQCWVVTAGGVYCLIAVYSNIKIMAVINLISIIFTVMEYNANNAKWVKVEEQLRKMETQLLNYKTTLLKVRGGGGGGRRGGWLVCRFWWILSYSKKKTAQIKLQRYRYRYRYRFLGNMLVPVQILDSRNRNCQKKTCYYPLAFKSINLTPVNPRDEGEIFRPQRVPRPGHRISGTGTETGPQGFR